MFQFFDLAILLSFFVLSRQILESEYKMREKWLSGFIVAVSILTMDLCESWGRGKRETDVCVCVGGGIKKKKKNMSLSRRLVPVHSRRPPPYFGVGKEKSLTSFMM